MNYFRPRHFQSFSGLMLFSKYFLELTQFKKTINVKLMTLSL